MRYHLLAKYGNPEQPVGTFDADQTTPKQAAKWIERELVHKPSQIVVTAVRWKAKKTPAA